MHLIVILQNHHSPRLWTSCCRQNRPTFRRHRRCPSLRGPVTTGPLTCMELPGITETLHHHPVSVLGTSADMEHPICMELLTPTEAVPTVSVVTPVATAVCALRRLGRVLISAYRLIMGLAVAQVGLGHPMGADLGVVAGGRGYRLSLPGIILSGKGHPLVIRSGASASVFVLRLYFVVKHIRCAP